MPQSVAQVEAMSLREIQVLGRQIEVIEGGDQDPMEQSGIAENEAEA